MDIIKYVNFIKQKMDLIRYIILKMLDMGMAFVLTLIIVRKLTAYEYGVYSLILTILGMLVTFGFSWTSSSLMYFGVDEKLKYGSLNRTFWARNIILLVSYSGILIMLLVFYPKINEYLTENVSFYLFGWMSIKVLSDYLSGYFLAIEKRELSALVTFTIKLVMIVFLLFSTMTLKKILILSILAESSFVIWLAKVDKKDFGRYVFDKKIFKEVLSFGLWQLFGFSGLYLINFGDNLVIKHFLTIKDVGIYNISYQLYSGMAGLSFLFGNYFAPQIVKAIRNKNISKINEIYKKDRFILVLLLGIPHIIVMILASKIIICFYGINYIKAISPLRVLTVASFVSYFAVFNMLTYNSFKKYHILQLLNIVQAVLNVILDIILVPYFGILGAAYGTVLAYFVVTILKTYFAERLLANFKRNIKS